MFDRDYEWDDLSRFVVDTSPGLRLGIVRGRRRHGKSFLLEHLCEQVNGVYTLAVRQSRSMALARFGDSLSRALGYNLGAFSTWVEALDTAVDALARASRNVLILDELPYLVAHSPELPSVIQALYDQRGPSTGHQPFKIILCGSALSTMSTLVSGDQALRGRAMIDLRLGPFRYRDTAQYWDVEPERAFLIDAVLGGAPGYRDLIGAAPGPTGEDFALWLARTLFNPSHSLFAEPDYLLAEDPRIGDRAIYHTIWEAVASGASSPTQIGGLVGMDAKALSYHLTIMRDGGFIRYEQDMLRQRRPVITIADPPVKFHNLLVRPNLLELEMREAEAVWERSSATFHAKILGPHFEEMAREWVRWYGRSAGLEVGQVGATEVACREHRGHEVDVVALDRHSLARNKSARITLLGEAKATERPRTLSDLERLRHIRDLLASHGWNAAGAALAVFSRTGFTDDLRQAARRDEVHLLDLADLYGQP